jgi:peptide/nickel transport system ATP-binding protein
MKVGLAPEMVSRFPHEFSGGQLQRMAIARASVLRPEVLIADEPASSLDVSVRAQILNLFRELTEDRSMALILIAHDLAAVAYTTKRIAVFSGGKIVEHGEVLSVLTAPREEATRELVRANISL